MLFWFRWIKPIRMPWKIPGGKDEALFCVLGCLNTFVRPWFSLECIKVPNIQKQPNSGYKTIPCGAQVIMQRWDSSLATRQQAAIIYCMLKSTSGSSWKYFKTSFIKEFVNGCIRVGMLALEPYFHFCDWRAETGREREGDGRHIELFQCNFLIIFYADFLHQAFRTRESIIKTITEVFVFFLSSQKCHRRARFTLALIYTPLWRYAIQTRSTGDGKRCLSVLRKFL